jgi:hypothetical protein
MSDSRVSYEEKGPIDGKILGIVHSIGGPAERSRAFGEAADRQMQWMEISAYFAALPGEIWP